MPRTVETTKPTVTIAFTLDEAKRIIETAERQAKECDNWFVVNSLDGLRQFIRQNERGA